MPCPHVFFNEYNKEWTCDILGCRCAIHTTTGLFQACSTYVEELAGEM